MRKIIGLGMGLIVVILLVLFSSFLLKSRSDSEQKAKGQTQKRYVALGDSVAAGVGLPTASDSSACDRTDEAYPNLVARSNNLILTSVACSGATFPTGITGPQTVNQLALEAQLEQLYKLERPDFITITSGANDMQWATNLTKCYTQTCGSAQDTAAVDTQLSQVTTGLKNSLESIQKQYKDALPTVVVTGYYQVFPAADTGCLDLTGITQSELEWGRQQTAKLNDALREATREYYFAQFASIDFTGHELCSAEPWIQSFIDPTPFHPT